MIVKAILRFVNYAINYALDVCHMFVQIWAPPTPPQDDNDIYMDQTLLFLHEPTVMAESQLPPVYARKDHKKPRVETITSEYLSVMVASSSCFY